MEKKHTDERHGAEKPLDANLDDQLDSNVNTEGFTKPYGESQTIDEDPDTDPNQTDKPGFRRNRNA